MSGVHAIALEREGSGLRQRMNSYDGKSISLIPAITYSKRPTPELLRSTEVTGSQLRTGCTAHLPTAATDTDSMCNTRVPNVKVCFLDSVADVSDKTDIFDSICVHRLAALHLSSGAWSEEEESQLLHAMKGLAKEGRTDKSARGYWVSVSKALDATQTPKQYQ